MGTTHGLDMALLESFARFPWYVTCLAQSCTLKVHLSNISYMKYFQTSMRTVPDNIGRPDYADHPEGLCSLREIIPPLAFLELSKFFRLSCK